MSGKHNRLPDERFLSGINATLWWRDFFVLNSITVRSLIN
jgi:hypothetical protein